MNAKILTQDAVNRFFEDCNRRGISPNTVRQYQSYLKYFVSEFPELPTDRRSIEDYLRKRGETPARRGDVFRRLQAFYSYLEREEGIPSPVPPKGPMGRPRKYQAPKPRLIPDNPGIVSEKVVKGGTASLSGTNFTSISTQEAVDAYIRDRELQGCSPNSITRVRQGFNIFIRQHPELPLTKRPIEDFLLSIRGEPETKLFYLNIIKALYHFLEGEKRIPRDLFEFPRIKKAKKVRRVLSAEELSNLFPYVQTFQERAILQTLIDSKARAGELVSLDRESIFPDHIIVQGKEGQRQVPINPETYDMLIQLAASGPLFRVRNRRMKVKYLEILLRRLMERAGLKGKKLGPHLIRHSAAVQHMIGGGDLMSLKEELGHSDVKITQVYAQLAAHDVKMIHRRVDVLGKITGGNGQLRAVCYGCGYQVPLEDPAIEKVKVLECPGCHQVGAWYLPNGKPQDVVVPVAPPTTTYSSEGETE